MKKSGRTLLPERTLAREAARLKYYENPEKFKKSATELRKRNKEKIFSHYGRVCVCCGEANEKFLSIDHVNNDGAEERRKFGSNGTNALIYRIVKQGFPDRYQILCYNCNMGKARNGGTCPHKDVK